MNQKSLPTTIKIDPLLKIRARFAVERITAEVKGIKAVVISTEDGFEVAALAQSSAQTSRLSAMASSFSALGMLVGDESQLGHCHSVMVEADDGYILILQIRHPKQALTMCVVAGRDSVMGQLLYIAKLTAKNLAQAD